MTTPTNSPKIDDGAKGEEKLLPCPFCGDLHPEEFRYVDGHRGFRVECCECGMSTNLCATAESARAIWNRRTPARPIAMPTNEPRKRIDGCKHPMDRMIDYINESACPICLLADIIEKSERLKEAEGLLKAVQDDLAIASENWRDSDAGPATVATDGRSQDSLDVTLETQEQISAFLARIGSAQSARSGKEGEGR